MNKAMSDNPLSKSRYMSDAKAQIPLRITREMIDSATYRIENTSSNSGYQAENMYKAAMNWIDALDRGYVWLSVAGAATPVGLGGLFADMVESGAVDAITTTGANGYHDLELGFGLPVRHGSCKVDDNELRKDETTRIYTQYIHNRYTLKTGDMLVQDYSKRILPRLKRPFSSASFLHEFGKEMNNDKDEVVPDKEGSFIARSAKYKTPVFLDSGSNHSIGMNLLALRLEGYDADISPTQDLLEASALCLRTQPQTNVFLGEGGPRNFTQTTAPTASEIFSIPFEGSEGCIRFTTADERCGALSGSTQKEALSWGKYSKEGEIEVWGDYTLTAPDVMAYVAGHINRRPRGLMGELDRITEDFIKMVKEHRPEVIASQNELRKIMPDLVRNEIEARKKAGYKFN
jgi:deoxyhypusine synthase